MGRTRAAVEDDLRKLRKFLNVRKGRSIYEIMKKTGKSRATADRWLEALPVRRIKYSKQRIVKWSCVL